MKHLFLFCCSLLCASVSFCQYTPVDKESAIGFKIKNLGFTVNGSFHGINGKISFDPQNLPVSSINVSVDAASVNTDNSMRDDHLRGEAYFDVTQYPRISFSSTKITASHNGSFLVAGRLTIRNVSKDISFPFTAKQVGTGYVFKGSFSVNRRDFGVGGVSIISDVLTVDLNVAANK